MRDRPPRPWVERLGLGFVLLALALLACVPSAGPRTAADVTPARVSLLSPAALPGEFQWRQRVTARWAQGERSFQAVVAKQGDVLQLLGLDPMGRPGFVFRLAPPGEAEREPRFSIEQRVDLELPFDPRHVVLDVQRVFYPWLGEAPLLEGTRSGVVQGQYVEEQWQEGKLLVRRFRDVEADTDAARPVVVRYYGWRDGRTTPERAVVENQRHGYTLTIETLSEQAL